MSEMNKCNTAQLYNIFSFPWYLLCITHYTSNVMCMCGWCGTIYPFSCVVFRLTAVILCAVKIIPVLHAMNLMKYNYDLTSGPFSSNHQLQKKLAVRDFENNIFRNKAGYSWLSWLLSYYETLFSWHLVILWYVTDKTLAILYLVIINTEILPELGLGLAIQTLH